MKSFFITATGTEIGKTYTTKNLIQQGLHQGKRIFAIKPVISGWEEDNIAATDCGVILQALKLEINTANINTISPWRFLAPLSPNMAAAREQKTIDVNEVISFCQNHIKQDKYDLFFVEGVGGAMVPLNDNVTTIDWMHTLKLKAIVVTGSYLGTISHTLTTIETLLKHKIDIAAIILNETSDCDISPDETENTLSNFVKDIPIFQTGFNIDNSNTFNAIIKYLINRA